MIFSEKTKEDLRNAPVNRVVDTEDGKVLVVKYKEIPFERCEGCAWEDTLECPTSTTISPGSCCIYEDRPDKNDVYFIKVNIK